MTLRDRLPARIDVALTIIVAAALFLYFFTPAILDVRNVGWLLRGTDKAENARGLHAWLADPHRHGFTTGLLNAPDGVTLLFTDSNPLLAMIVGPVRGRLAATCSLSAGGTCCAWSCSWSSRGCCWSPMRLAG